MLTSLPRPGIHDELPVVLGLQSVQMLKFVRFRSQRRLLRRPDLHPGLRQTRECGIADLPVQVAQLEAWAGRNEARKVKDRRSALQSLHSGCWTERPSFGEGLSWLRESAGQPRRSRLVNVNCQRRSLDNYAGDLSLREGRGNLLQFPRAVVQPLSLSPAQPTRGLAYHYAEEFSDEDVLSTDEKDPVRLVDLESWRSRFSRFLKQKDKELVSKAKKDVVDFPQITDLVREFGLYGQLYEKVVVISKEPLPNYRPDLDEKLPQREVSISHTVWRDVGKLIDDHIDQKKQRLACHDGAVQLENRVVGSTEDAETDMWRREEFFRTRPDALPDDVLERRNMRMRLKQRSWQESEQGLKMATFRRSLPSYKERDALLAAISLNQVLVISGETGCGKTTQLPQYILESEVEAGRGSSCSIICTQPRRISAISVSERVAAERGEEIGDSVGYKVRLEGMRGSNTRLLFCTTGVLLRRLMSDPDLHGISHVIVDEIHERGMNEDFLLIVLKDVLPRRPDLKLLLMSATLNAELFSSFFDNAPMIHIPGFTHPVQAHFLEDILEITGHRLTPINQLDDYGADKIWKKYRQLATRKKKNNLTGLVEDAMADQSFDAFSDRTQASMSCWSGDGLGFNLITRVLSHICRNEREGAVLVFMTGWEDIGALMDILKVHHILGDTRTVQLVACHGSMGTAEQRLIFDKPPLGIRKVVLATNMAETSITIPDVVFVIDTGKCKETSYDALNNTPCLLTSWISQASARQRRGRAGRVRPGVCYHLYPKAVHDALPDYQQPELLRTPLHSLCLQIKSLQLGDISAFLSRALQPPESLAVKNSVDLLKTIGALDENEDLTHLGRHLSMLPIEPRLGKMLILGAVFRCLDPILTIAASCTSRDAFVMPMDKKQLSEQARHKFAGNDFSDHMTIVRAYEAWQDAMKQGSAGDFCWRNFLSMQTLMGIASLRRQFMGLLQESGFVDARQGISDEYSHDRDLVRGVICAALFPAVVSAVHRPRSTVFKTLEDGQVLLHSSSINAQETVLHYPWLVYNEKLKTSSVFIRDSTGISDSMMLLFAGQLKRGEQPGQLVMQGGYLEFFMEPQLAVTIWKLRGELDELLQRKLANPEVDIYEEGGNVIRTAMDLMHGDDCEGKWIYGRKPQKVVPPKVSVFLDVKTLLFNLLGKTGKKMPVFKTREMKGNQFQSVVEVKGHVFLGQPALGKKQAERNASEMALEWLTGVSVAKMAPEVDPIEGVKVVAEKMRQAALSPPSSRSSSNGIMSKKVRRTKTYKLRA